MKIASILTKAGDVRLATPFTSSGRGLLIDITQAYAELNKAHEEPAVATRATVARIPPNMLQFLEGGPAMLSAAREAVAYTSRAMGVDGVREAWLARGIAYEQASVSFLAPVPRPGKIISIGANYRKHLDELAADRSSAGLESVAARLSGSNYPPAFSKLPSTVTGHEHPVIYSRSTKQLDYEAELCAVIGRRCRNVSVTEALGVVAGYTIINDISMRDIQREEMSRGMLLLGKNLDTTAPVGPYLVTADEIPDPQNLRIRCWVNGELRQNASTSEMIYSVAEIISYYSKMTLEPGDMFTTGSPAGVGVSADPPERHLLKPGDVVEIEIDPIGRLCNRILEDT